MPHEAESLALERRALRIPANVFYLDGPPVEVQEIAGMVIGVEARPLGHVAQVIDPGLDSRTHGRHLYSALLTKSTLGVIVSCSRSALGLVLIFAAASGHAQSAGEAVFQKV